MVAKLSGATQRAILETLAVHEELTTAELSRLIGKRHDTVHSSLLLLRDQHAVYIKTYITTAGKGRESRVWALGDQPDATRPNYAGSHRRRLQRESSRRSYLKRALKRDGVNPWTGLLPVVERKVRVV